MKAVKVLVTAFAALAVLASPAAAAGDSIDLDGDGEMESVVTSDNLPAGEAKTFDVDNDGDVDIVVVGTGKKECSIEGPIGDESAECVTDALQQQHQGQPVDIDNDRELEMIYHTDNLPAGEVKKIDVDNDGDVDIVVVGTGPA